MTIISSVARYVVKKIDVLGTYIINMCAQSLKNKIGDEQLLNELIFEIKKRRQAHKSISTTMLEKFNRTLQNSSSKSHV